MGKFAVWYEPRKTKQILHSEVHAGQGTKYDMSRLEVVFISPKGHRGRAFQMPGYVGLVSMLEVVAGKVKAGSAGVGVNQVLGLLCGDNSMVATGTSTARRGIPEVE